MKTVRLIDDYFDYDASPQWLKNIVIVGEELPIKGEIYTVKTEYYSNGKTIGYILEEFPFSNYTNYPLFKAERFETVETKFTPNAVDEDGNLVETKQLIIKLDIDI